MPKQIAKCDVCKKEFVADEDSIFGQYSDGSPLYLCEEHESEAQYLNDDLKPKPAEKIDLFGYLFASQFATDEEWDAIQAKVKAQKAG